MIKQMKPIKAERRKLVEIKFRPEFWMSLYWAGDASVLYARDFALHTSAERLEPSIILMVHRDEVVSSAVVNTLLLHILTPSRSISLSIIGCCGLGLRLHLRVILMSKHLNEYQHTSL